MRRGFKADAERRAEAARAGLGLLSLEKLCPWVYADNLGILVMGADELNLDPIHAAQLLQKDPESWSGMTLDEDGVKLIVLNSSEKLNRQHTTLMHEIAHILLEHVPATVNLTPSGLTLLSDYSDDQEDEADWLGGALLIPEPTLMHYRSQGYSVESIANLYGLTRSLVTWRCRMTGVEKRMSYRRRA